MGSPTEENLRTAQAWLTRVTTLAVQTHNTQGLIQVQPLQAILSAAQGRARSRR